MPLAPRPFDPPSPTLAGTGRRVLVVEDDPALSSAIDVLLRHYGYAVQMAATLADARRHLAGGDPDVVVLDLGLPDGNGADLLEQMRSTGRRARVLVLTASVDPPTLRRLKGLRPDRFLRKPMNFLDLLDGIRGEVVDATVGVVGRAAAAGSAA